MRPAAPLLGAGQLWHSAHPPVGALPGMRAMTPLRSASIVSGGVNGSALKKLPTSLLTAVTVFWFASVTRTVTPATPEQRSAVEVGKRVPPKLKGLFAATPVAE